MIHGGLIELSNIDIPVKTVRCLRRDGACPRLCALLHPGFDSASPLLPRSLNFLLYSRVLIRFSLRSHPLSTRSNRFDDPILSRSILLGPLDRTLDRFNLQIFGSRIYTSKSES